MTHREPYNKLYPYQLPADNVVAHSVVELYLDGTKVYLSHRIFFFFCVNNRAFFRDGSVFANHVEYHVHYATLIQTGKSDVNALTSVPTLGR